MLDEDEEKARVVSTAGVDAEDANVSGVCPIVLAVCALVERALVACSDWSESWERHSMEC